MKRFTAREILLVLSDVAILFSFLNVLQTDKSITHWIKRSNTVVSPHDGDGLRLSQTLGVCFVLLSQSLQSSPGSRNIRILNFLCRINL